VRKKAASGGPINVKWYGAKGDGASNDTDSIQKAIDKNPEGVVHFPKGVFVIEKSIDINQFGGTIKGEGPEESVITSESPVLIDCFVFSESSDTPRTSGTTIKDIQIKGSRTNEPWEARGSEGISDAITGFNVQNINIKNVKIRNIEGHGVLFLGGRSKWSQNIKVESCTFIRTASHCVSFEQRGASKPVEDSIISNCYMEKWGNNDGGTLSRLAFDISDKTKRCQASNIVAKGGNNAFKGQGDDGVYSNLTFEDIGGYAIIANGDGNKFSNIKSKKRSNNVSSNVASLSGNRNKFVNVELLGLNETTLISGKELSFLNCKFGMESVPSGDEGVIVKNGASVSFTQTYFDRGPLSRALKVGTEGELELVSSKIVYEGEDSATWGIFPQNNTTLINTEIVNNGTEDRTVLTTTDGDNLKIIYCTIPALSISAGNGMLVGNDIARDDGSTLIGFQTSLNRGQGAPNNREENITKYTAAMGDGTQDPTTDSPSDWIETEVGGAKKFIPVYD
jgi:hypothetical protein